MVLTIGAVCGKNLIWSEGDFGLALEMEELGSHQPTIGPHQDDANLHQAESGGSQHNNLVVNPQQRGDHEGRATSPMQRMKETCNVKLMSWRRSYVAHDEGAHHLIPSCLPRRQMMLHIGEDPDLHLMRLSLVTRNIAIGARIGARPIKALETMPWTRRWVKLLIPLSREI